MPENGSFTNQLVLVVTRLVGLVVSLDIRHSMELSEVCDFTDVFIRETFFTEDCWSYTSDYRIGRFLVDYMFEDFEGSVSLVHRIDEPIVANDHLSAARQVLGAYRLLNPHVSVEFVLVYRELLIDPNYLPQGVKVVSISDGYLDTIEQEDFSVLLN